MPFSSVYRLLNPCRLHKTDTPCYILYRVPCNCCNCHRSLIDLLQKLTGAIFICNEHAMVQSHLCPEVGRVDVAADAAGAVHHDWRVRGHVLKVGWKLLAAGCLCRRLIKGVLRTGQGLPLLRYSYKTPCDVKELALSPWQKHTPCYYAVTCLQN